MMILSQRRFIQTCATTLSFALFCGGCNGGRDLTGKGLNDIPDPVKVSKSLSQNEIEVIKNPGFLSGYGFKLHILKVTKTRLAKTAIRFPELPRRGSVLQGSIRVPEGDGDRIKALGGNVTFVIRGEGKTLGGTVKISQLSVAKSYGFNDKMYSLDWREKGRNFDPNWQPKLVEVAFEPAGRPLAIPMEFVLQSGGYK